MHIDIRRIYRCNKIVGTRVRNAVGQNVGRLDDLVMDLEANRIAFGILSYGGFLGLGARRFAIPWDEFSLQFNEDRKQFLLDVDPSKLMQVRSISQRQSLDFSDPSFRRELDDVYQQIRRNRVNRPGETRSAAQHEPSATRSTAPSAEPVMRREMELPNETMMSRDRGPASLMDDNPVTRQDVPPGSTGAQTSSSIPATSPAFRENMRIDSRSDSALP